jgi:hypothetical protein
MFNLFSSEPLKKVSLKSQWGNSFTKVLEVFGNPRGQTCYRMTGGLVSPLPNFSQAIVYRLEQFAEGIGQQSETFSKGFPHCHRKEQPCCNTSEEPEN